MGYTTDFFGSLSFNKPVEEWLVKYINQFSEVRHMKRDVSMIKEKFPNWRDLCFRGVLGVDGEYFIGGGMNFFNDPPDDTIVNHNMPPHTQPELWCQWIIDDYGNLAWDGGEKFYEYVEWLKYLIDNFFAPLGYSLNGEIEFQGEDYEDFGTIFVENNLVDVKYGVRVRDMGALDTQKMIKELEKRGYSVKRC